MKKSPPPLDYVIIFVISFVVIALELFLTRILSLKTWNHIVYLVIPFAILGYGIGANISLIGHQRIRRMKKTNIILGSLLATGVTSVLGVLFLIRLEVHLEKLLAIHSPIDSILMLLMAYTAVFIPFIPFGFLVVYLFSHYPTDSNRLYFVDLLGAGLGALAFVFLINHLGVFPSIVILSLIILFLFMLILQPDRKLATAILFAGLIAFTVKFIPEPLYAIDEAKGWENIPAHYKKDQYEHLLSQWHALGRTDLYRIKDIHARNNFLTNAYFRINLTPAPEFSYFTTNITAGTPVFKLSEEGLKESGSHIQLFSQPFEVPYTLLNQPDVVVIGAGGGRDIFIAKTHGAKNIIGAEINPVTYQEMSPGGSLFDYTGGIYTADNVHVSNIDGRHFVKKLMPHHYDLIVLTGVDTFSGLSNGAYTYAESYLYTKNAVENYLHVLKDNGILNFNRRLFPDKAREELRLFALSLDALRALGAPAPWDHIVVGGFQKWSIILVKKTPFTPEERSQLNEYFQSHQTKNIFPHEGWRAGTGEQLTTFDEYAKAFAEGTEKQFEQAYPYDVSVITDDNPFFYKYYKFNLFNPFAVEYDRHTGTLIFITQGIVLAQALLFILLFIFLPLIKSKSTQVNRLPKKSIIPFITYFSCLGTGFMFIEIPLMQKFVLLLGSPIYSLSVTLTALLIFTGLGSYLSEYRQEKPLLKWTLVALSLLMIALIKFGTPLLDHAIQLAFPGRILIVILTLLPFGICLGVYFPSGLRLIGVHYRETIAWAWGLNSGFSVLGSILAIIMAQFLGFNFVLWMALVIYLIATMSFYRMKNLLS